MTPLGTTRLERIVNARHGLSEMLDRLRYVVANLRAAGITEGQFERLDDLEVEIEGMRYELGEEMKR